MPRTRKRYASPVDETTIGKRLREFRQQRGLTQAELAEKLQIQQALVSEYERGTVRIHGALIAGFAKVLQASADEILGLKSANSSHVVTDRRLVRLLQQIHELSRRDREALIKTIDNYLKGSRVA